MRTILQALRFLILMTILTGLIYPLLITGIGQGFFSHKANGSFILEKDKIIGSLLIGEKFTSNKYFWSRPSAIEYNPLPSGGSNLGPTSGDLQKIVEERKRILEMTNPHSKFIPSELIFASGSGLDPHISPEAARFQIGRITLARGLDSKQRELLINLVEKHIEPPVFGFLGESRVNVLRLNIALDSIFTRGSNER
jgi:K+-transporting ATPase ATPase C chain